MDRTDRKIVTMIAGTLLILILTVYMSTKRMLDTLQEAHMKSMRQFSILILSVDTPEKLEALKRAIIDSEFVKEEDENE